MRVVLDAGALIAIDRGDRKVAALLELARRAGSDIVTSAPIIGQVWRDGARQAVLVRALRMVDVHDTTSQDAQTAGQLMGRINASDVVDALVSLLVRSGDQILTSDPDDIEKLLSGRNVSALVVRV
jgi:predicted nucleic acid-binding protein